MNPQVALHVAICRCKACGVHLRDGKAHIGPMVVEYRNSLWLVYDPAVIADPHAFATADLAVAFAIDAANQATKDAAIQFIGGPADGGVLRTKLADIPITGALMPYRRQGGRQSHMYRFARGAWRYMGIEAIIEEIADET